MKITMNQVLELKALYEVISKQTLSIKLTYKLSKFFAPIISETEYYSKQMNKLIEDYADRDEEGNFKVEETGKSILIKKDKIREVEEKLKELSELEVEISDAKFGIEELEQVKLSVEEFKALMPFVEE